jgi:hypothetical protein
VASERIDQDEVAHTVRNVGRGESRWLYGYKR